VKECSTREPPLEGASVDSLYSPGQRSMQARSPTPESKCAQRLRCRVDVVCDLVQQLPKHACILPLTLLEARVLGDDVAPVRTSQMTPSMLALRYTSASHRSRAPPSTACTVVGKKEGSCEQGLHPSHQESSRTGGASWECCTR